MRMLWFRESIMARERRKEMNVRGAISSCVNCQRYFLSIGDEERDRPAKRHSLSAPPSQEEHGDSLMGIVNVRFVVTLVDVW